MDKEEQYRQTLRDYTLPAADMYEGSFKYVRELVGRLRSQGRKADLFIISARYGLIHEKTPIVPYECTLQGLKKDQLESRIKELRILESLRRLLRQTSYNHIIVILGRDYLKTILDPDRGRDFLEQIQDMRLTTFTAESVRRLFGHKQMEFISVRGIGDRNKKIAEYTTSSKKKTLF